MAQIKTLIKVKFFTSKDLMVLEDSVNNWLTEKQTKDYDIGQFDLVTVRHQADNSGASAMALYMEPTEIDRDGKETK